MSFRTRVVLATAVAVAASVWIVALAVTYLIAEMYSQQYTRRTAQLVEQFRREYDNRGQDLARRVDAIAASADIARIAAVLAEPIPDTAQFLSDAAAIAQQQSLDFLEITGPDNAIITSAQWPARFGYREDWLSGVDWQKAGVFLRREPLPDGTSSIGLFVVRQAGNLRVAGGIRLSPGFIDSLTLPQGMKLALWDASKPAPPAANPDTETVTRLPLETRDGAQLGALVITNSRDDLIALLNYTRLTALGVGIGGVLFGIALSWWVASRVTKPVRVLAGTVRQVAEGNWDARAGIQSRDEIGRLAADFNQMTAQLIEQKQRMVQAERVAAWRELARRLAHELKNPLFPLQITVENLKRARAAGSQDFDEIFEESTTTLLAELQNLKTIIGRFSDFARMPAPQLETVDINALVRDVAKFHSAPAVLELDPALPTIQADPDQIRRALRNLVLNAMDAMPEGGTVTLRTRTHGTGVTIEVADQGQGLTPEECDRLFTPYYTTKQHGTGLGLAIVQSVVSDHHGSIQVSSAPGKGATFRIDLPEGRS